ncbi:peptide-methionine (S)-S-oxide reductase [Candidatus Kaiserbacteria bacterium RIFCSPLOWO2_01_FULL_53_17]|uniref:Peptide methionine sulfoxide reductase MsrA n=1 Tax=Candidatus Kaiserbacteria bacterium RIFCSPLOWO2_01_FULL_53_17 TaxID=1798511 RepID=A0A1F6EH94_9BACT|nr:MAG: peptide-methionine (S)-S-oxide reductase [Candidatus Kaiserbacteria bacterium RIFCSPLOWO2_01_FULL_53_17]
MKTAVFGGGCFWCTEAVFKMLKGVNRIEPGYAGGFIVNPSYEQVSAGDTGHAEVIRVTYDPTLISYEDLLTVFFGSHDPTTPNRQGNDVGEQYRSVIFYQDEEEKRMAGATIEKFQDYAKEGLKIVTQVLPLRDFFPAEDYHKDYYKKNSSANYCQLIIEPKLEKVRKRFAELVRPEAH